MATKTRTLRLAYSGGQTEEIEVRADCKAAPTAVRRLIARAHRQRHWGHGVLSIDAGPGIGAEQVYSVVTTSSLHASSPYALPQPWEPILDAVRRLCLEPRNVNQFFARGSARMLRAGVSSIVWPGQPPAVEAAGDYVAAWAMQLGPGKAVSRG